MSRLPQPSTRSQYKTTPATPTKPRAGSSVNAPVPPRARTKSTGPAKSPARPPPNSVKERAEPVPPTPTLSVREAIALKRAEAKKAAVKSRGGSAGLDNVSSLEDALPVPATTQEEEDVLGRSSVRETIENARSTGSLNISSRLLPCIPSALFQIHLGITPDPLKSVPNEPPLPESAPRRGRKETPAWFEAQDLQILKAWSNDIQEVQHEISLFGSLKAIDLHKNKITSLPDSFGDLTNLATLDLSHNALKSLPINLFSLPELTNLTISHNELTSLHFNAPFASGASHSRGNTTSSGLFGPTITRASVPLPRLVVLDASHNKITANAIDLEIPKWLVKVDLSSNPLGTGGTSSLIKTFGSLERLKELRLESADIGDDAFPRNLFSSTPFPSIQLLDLGQTRVTPEAAKEALKGMTQEVTFDVTTEDPPQGVARIIVGKKPVKEPWEVEAERRAKARAARVAAAAEEVEFFPFKGKVERKGAGPVVKEAWEIEAEQGLLTEGGKRRARAMAAAAAASKDDPVSPTDSTSAASDRAKSPNAGISLENPKYYTEAKQILTLPPSSAPTKSPGHGRAFSLAMPSSFASGPSQISDIALPTPTLPLTSISAQSFAVSLKILILKNRRLDRSFALPASDHELLPSLEELSLEGCGLGDLVSVSRQDPAATSRATPPPHSNEPLLPLLISLFPSLRTLDLSYNALTSDALPTEVLSPLILSTSHDESVHPRRPGLKHLRLRGNRISHLGGFQGIAEMFKGNRDVPGWKLDELDVRDNEVSKLPPELGLLPLDVFLVDGNLFRVPQSRVWEREGTKGLLSWLRLRIE